MSDAYPAASTGASPNGPLLEAMLNLSRVHREHEKFYSSAPRQQVVILQRHSRTLLALADKWTTTHPSPAAALNPFAGADDLNAEVATQLDGVLFMEGQGRPAEITRLIAELRSTGTDSMDSGAWLVNAMQASWDLAATLIEIDQLAGVMGDRHRIISNDWQAAELICLAGRILLRAADILDQIDFIPAALRTDLAHNRTSPRRLYSAAEMIAHAADLISQAAGAELDSEPRWRAFRNHIQEVAGAPVQSGPASP
jgi:hypothetical protein